MLVSYGKHVYPTLYSRPPPLSIQARELKLPEFQLRILCDEWGKLDRDATYLLPVHQLPLLWQTVSREED